MRARRPSRKSTANATSRETPCREPRGTDDRSRLKSPRCTAPALIRDPTSLANAIRLSEGCPRRSSAGRTPAWIAARAALDGADGSTTTPGRPWHIGQCRLAARSTNRPQTSFRSLPATSCARRNRHIPSRIQAAISENSSTLPLTVGNTTPAMVEPAPRLFNAIVSSSLSDSGFHLIGRGVPTSSPKAVIR
jgi:hypothetical protein